MKISYLLTNQFRFIITPLMLLIFVYFSFGQNQNEISDLSLNRPVEKTIKGGERNSFKFNVKGGFYARVEVEQQNIDVVVSLFAPDDKLVVEMDGKDGRLWREAVSAIADKDGVYRIEIKAYGVTAAAGSYKIEITELRPVSAKDRSRLAAEKLLGEGRRLENDQIELPKAVQNYEAAIELWQKNEEKFWEATTRLNLGLLSAYLAQYEKASISLNGALDIFQEIKNPTGKAKALNGLGNIFYYTGKYEKALDSYQQSLALWQQTGNKTGEAKAILFLGFIQNALGKYEKARENFEQTLILARELKDKNIEGFALSNLGTAAIYLGQYEKAREYYEQALIIFRELKSRRWEGSTYKDLGVVYYYLSQPDKARQFYEQALAVSRELKDKRGESAALLNLAAVYSELTQYEKAIGHYEVCLIIIRELKDLDGEVKVLFNVGHVYEELAQFDKARNYYDQALTLARALKNRQIESNALNGLGNIYQFIRQIEKARECYEQSLAITRELKDQFGEAQVLDNLGIINTELKLHEKARVYYEQALAIRRELKDKRGEARTLYDIGTDFLKARQFEQSQKYYEKALIINKEVKDNLGLVYSLQGLMLTLSEQGKFRAAIYYGKQSVNTLQEIRSNIKGLDKESQISFFQSKESNYRKLADILIAEGRIIEAQTVLDLLKDEEYEQLTRSGEIADTIPYNKAEADVIAKVENLVVMERERTELQKILSANGELSAEQNNKLAKLNLDIAAANEAFDAALDRLGKTEESVATRVAEIKGGKVLQSALTELNEKTNSGVVALYTVLGTEKEADDKSIKDKLNSKFGWVIMVTENRYTAYPIDVTNLEETVFQFRNALSSDKYDPQPLAEKIYNAIFRQTSPKLKRTLEKDLQEYLKPAKDKTLMWSLDGVLRYIPMAALHDGKQYLVENYRNTVFNKESFVWLMNEYHADWKALGLGVSEKRPNFSALPGVKIELETIVREPNSPSGILNGSIKLNENFKKQTFFNVINAGAFPVVHISSHYSFDSVKPENSFLLAGDGNLTFAEIKQQQNLFKKVDLLTLSACDTGVSGNGKEAEGFAYLAQSLGAKAVIASLWKVSDTGTPELMTRFYRRRAENPQLSKGEAFRQAQLSLLFGDTPLNKIETNKPSRAEIVNDSSTDLNLPLFVRDDKKPFAHPHYWSSFVLIGNWR